MTEHCKDCGKVQKYSLRAGIEGMRRGLTIADESYDKFISELQDKAERVSGSFYNEVVRVATEFENNLNKALSTVTKLSNLERKVK